MNLANKLKVLIQQMRARGLKPRRILMNEPLKEAIYTQLDHKLITKTAQSGYTFQGIPIHIDDSVKDFLVQIDNQHDWGLEYASSK